MAEWSSRLVLIVLLLYSMADVLAQGDDQVYCRPGYYKCDDNKCCSENLRTWTIIGIVFSMILMLSICCSCCKYCMQERIKQQQREQLQRRRPNAIVAVITPVNHRPAFRSPRSEWQYTAPPPPYTLHNLYPVPPSSSASPGNIGPPPPQYEPPPRYS